MAGIGEDERQGGGRERYLGLGQAKNSSQELCVSHMGGSDSIVCLPGATTGSFTATTGSFTASTGGLSPGAFHAGLAHIACVLL